MLNNPAASYAGKVAQVLYFKDEIARVQLVLPSNCVVDLTRLAREIGRELRPLDAEEIKHLKQRYGLKDFPTPPQPNLVENWLDEALAELPEVIYWNESGWQRASSERLADMVRLAKVGRFSQPLPKLEFDAGQDAKAINGAIHAFTALRIKQRLAETLDLPPLPESANRIIALRADINAGPKELAQAVELDPSLSAQVVNWASSPFYGQRGSVHSVEDAIVRVLGFDMVINLALGLALGRNFTVPKDGARGYTPFWQQSVMTAALCNELVRIMPVRLRPNAGLMYLCGLLHNFGFLILGQVFPPQFELVNRHVEANPHLGRMYIEQHVLGMTREQIAALLLEQWRMPLEVISAIRQQQNPKYTRPHAVYAQLLYLCARALRQQGIGDGASEPIPDYLLDALGLNLETVTEVTQNLLARMDDLKALSQMLGR